MFVPPLVATVVASAFTAAAVRAAWRRHSIAMGIWGIALGQFALASAALAIGVTAGWSPATFRVYYLFGAITNVVWLGLGTVWLLTPRPVALGATAVAVAFSVAAGIAVIAARFLPGAGEALGEAIPSAKLILSSEVRMLSRVGSLGGSVVVLAGLVWSIIRRRGQTVGLVLLAVGIVIVAVAGEFARVGSVVPFSVGLAVGVAVMYAGFLRTGTRRARLIEDVAAS